jgi:ABC-type sugar transport system ATPase subunit
MTSIRFHKLKTQFGDVIANDIDDLTISSGEIVCFVGPSGCGKTTALRTIAGLVRHSEGDVYFGDRLVNELPPERRNAAMVFQNYALFPHMTVFENVAFGLTVRRQPKAQIAQKVSAVLELVQLPDVGDRLPKQLSGGQQQRIAVARALATEPDILLFDEPLSNLDAKLREYMRFELRRLLESLNVTTVYVTHDQTEAMVVGDRLIVMSGGRILQDATPAEVYHRPVGRFVADFIGTASFIEGHTVVGNGVDGFLQLQTPDGMSIWGAGVGIGPEEPAVACVRPEAIQFVDNVGEGRNRYRAKVSTALDLGGAKEVHLSIGSFVLRTHAPASMTLKAGSDVTIEILAERCSIIAP